MQIHELTQSDQEQLDEVIGGLARMAGQAIAKSPVGQAVGQAVGAAKQGFQQSAVGQTLQKAGDVERQAKMSAQTQGLAKAALQQWNNKVLQLTQANKGQPVSDQEYFTQLQDFVNRVMLQGAFSRLDGTSAKRVKQAIAGVTGVRNNPTQLQDKMEQLVTTASASRQDPNAYYGAPRGSAAKAPTGAAQAGAAQQAAPLVQQFLNQSVSAVQQQGFKTFLQQYAGTGAVRSTGNATVDAFLKELGLRVQ
jgi:hypothetical protein